MPPVNGNSVVRIENFRIGGNIQEASDLTFQDNNNHETATTTFISVFDDADFLQTSTRDCASYFPISTIAFGESDPFHSDWPYWNHN
jgi:hypothetical protein